MGFIDDDQIPMNLLQCFRPGLRELVGADDYLPWLFKWIGIAFFL